MRMPPAQDPLQVRYVGLMMRDYPRRMVDETIIGGPFVRYVPDPGTMFMVTEQVGAKEFVRAFCPRVIWDRWGSFTVGAFLRYGCDETEDYWVERIEEEVIVTDAMTIYQVSQEAWMNNWKNKKGVSQRKPILPRLPQAGGREGVEVPRGI